MATKIDLPGLGDGELVNDNDVTRSVQQMLPGYPKLAAYLSSNDNLMVYRRFSYVQSRLLLAKQDNLRQMEDKLVRLDGLDPDNHLISRRNMMEDELLPVRRALLVTLEQEWVAYAKLLLLAAQVTALDKPTDATHRDIRKHMSDNNAAFDPKSQFLNHKADLITLLPLPKKHTSSSSGDNDILAQNADIPRKHKPDLKRNNDTASSVQTCEIVKVALYAVLWIATMLAGNYWFHSLIESQQKIG